MLLGAVAGVFALSLGYSENGYAEDRERLFMHALDAFDKAKSHEDFERSALLFESILSDGYENGAVLYNLGNAYMRAGKVGKALAAYRRAARYRPRDPYLDANLRVALSQAPGHLGASAAPWWHRVLFWHTSLSQNERQGLCAGLWALVFLLAVIRLGLGHRAQGWPGLKWGLCVGLLVGVLLSVSVGLGYRDEALTQRGVVLVEVHARKGNGEDYAAAFTQPMKEGAEFTVLESRPGWIRVDLPNLGEGWLPGRDVVVY